MPSIKDSLKHSLASIEDSAEQCGRQYKDICLVAVSKTKPIQMIEEAYRAGQRHFGENRMLELQEKATTLSYSDIQWHMIGTLQTNKIKYIAPYVHWIHSVYKAKQLDEIEKRAAQHNRTIQVLLQVNISDEDQKGGCLPSEVPNLLAHAQTMKHVKIRGLMGMAKFTDHDDEIRSSFQLLAKTLSENKSGYPELCELSMGMSNDYMIAIEEGATMLRIGSAIFGGR